MIRSAQKFLVNFVLKRQRLIFVPISHKGDKRSDCLPVIFVKQGFLSIDTPEQHSYSLNNKLSRGHYEYYVPWPERGP
jgi:hypothetical protein